MRVRPSLLEFLTKHPVAIFGTLILHGTLIGSTFYFAQTPSKKSTLFNKQLSAQQRATNKIEEKKATDNVKIIQAEIVDSTELTERVAELKRVKKAERQAQLERLLNIQREQRKLSVAERHLANERKKLAQKRLVEEKKLAKLRTQKEKIKNQRDQLIAQEKLAAQELKKHNKATRRARKKLRAINKQQKQTKKILKKLEQQNEKTKQANSELIKQALEEQRRLEELRSQEELKIAQTAEKRKQLELEAKQKEDRLKSLADQEKQQTDAIQQRLDKLASIQQTELGKLKAQYITRIRQSVRSNWFEPPNSRSSWTCNLTVEQTPSGSIKSVKINQCSQGATRRFKHSVIKAVRRSDPLPQAPDIKVFESRISFEFIP